MKQPKTAIDILLRLERETYADGAIGASVLLMHAIEYCQNHPWG
jgi:hypothetical protein